MLVFRGEYGFVGVKLGINRIESYRLKYDVFFVICSKGKYKISIVVGKFWSIDDGNNIVLCDDESGVGEYFIEFFKYNRMVIKVENGFYI